jgi:hypothetical protein
MTPGMGPEKMWDPSAREYQEQKDGFLVIGSRTGEGLKNLGFFQTQEQAEDSARKQVKDNQYDNAWVVPAKLFFGAKPLFGF